MTEGILEQSRLISERYNVSSLCAKVFAASALNDEQIEELLAGDETLSTSRAECVRQACERILRARENHEKVFVGGDYDRGIRSFRRYRQARV